MRIGESNTFCRFVANAKTRLIKDSDMGMHLFDTYTKEILYDEDTITIHYDLMIENEIIDTISMIWEITRR